MEELVSTLHKYDKLHEEMIAGCLLKKRSGPELGSGLLSEPPTLVLCLKY